MCSGEIRGGKSRWIEEENLTSGLPYITCSGAGKRGVLLWNIFSDF